MLTRTGIGVIKQKGMFAQKATRTRKVGDPIDPPHGRTWAWMVRKRAEQDVYRALSLINANFLHNSPVEIVVQDEGNHESLEEFNRSLFG